jgi:acetyltransferase EpsM
MIYIIGDGGHSKIIKDILGNKEYSVFDDKIEGKTINDLFKILREDKSRIHKIIIAIGNNKARFNIYKKLYNQDFFEYLFFINVISKHAIISPNIRYMGKGNVICAGAVIESDCLIGDFNIINTNSSINHESRLKNFIHLSPHSSLCGNCFIDSGVMIPTGYNIIPKWKISLNENEFFNI